MENEMTQTTASEADNSSDVNIREQIDKALDEPDIPADDNNEAEKATEVKDDNSSSNTTSQQDNIGIQCPDKFKKADGTADWEKILKSYTELESQNSKEKAEWEKERADLLPYKEQINKQKQAEEETAKQRGFDSVLEMEQEYALVSLKANEYAQYLHYTEDPEATRKLLEDYISNPSDELLADIEMEFPASVIKKVTRLEEAQKKQFEAQASTQAETLKMANIENVIAHAVDTDNELFNYEPFKNLFLNTLHKFGDSFTIEDSDALINAFAQMKELFKKEFDAQSATNKQNELAPDRLSSISNTTSAPNQEQVDISGMNQKQLVKYLKDLV